MHLVVAEPHDMTSCPWRQQQPVSLGGLSNEPREVKNWILVTTYSNGCIHKELSLASSSPCQHGAVR